MAMFPLKDNVTLQIEPSGKKLRLVISEGDTQHACRMETAANIKRFLASADTRLFKGRVQLHKQGDEIIIVKFKGDEMGLISADELLSSL